MKSKKYSLSLRDISQVLWASLIGVLSIYASNTNFFNEMISKYLSPDIFAVMSMILAYAVKKFLTDYANNK